MHKIKRLTNPRKLDTKEYTLYDSIYMKSKNRQANLWWEKSLGEPWGRLWLEFSKGMEISFFGVVVTWECRIVKAPWTEQLKSVHFLCYLCIHDYVYLHIHIGCRRSIKLIELSSLCTTSNLINIHILSMCWHSKSFVFLLKINIA